MRKNETSSNLASAYSRFLCKSRETSSPKSAFEETRALETEASTLAAVLTALMVSAQLEKQSFISHPHTARMEKDKLTTYTVPLLKAIDELVTTEKTYVKDLEDMCTVYIPCCQASDYMSDSDISVIFSNLHDLMSLHQDLLKDLLQARGDLQKISKCFTDRAPEFIVYTNYCTRYHRANERLFELKHQILEVPGMLNEIQLSLGHSLPLSSYLHKPVQRILKYHLILKNLMSLCDDDSSRMHIAEAYDSMADCAQQINNSKRLTEMDIQTRELHELILAIRESDHLGKLIREGEMILKQGKHSSEVFLYLFENVMVVCHKPKDVFSLHSILRCSDLLILENCSRRELEFSVVPFSTPSHAISLTAKNLTQKLDWCIQLHKLTNHNIPAKAKKLLISQSKLERSQESNQSIFHQSTPVKRPYLNLFSPRFLGRRAKQQVGSFTPEMKDLSRSNASLAGSTSDLSITAKIPGSSSDTLSHHSLCSGSSDLGSSIISGSDRLPSPTSLASFDDSCGRFKKLGEDIKNHNLDSWYYLLRSRIQRMDIKNDTHTSVSKIHRSRSCAELLHRNNEPECSIQFRRTSRPTPTSSTKKNRRRSLLDIPSMIFKAWQNKKPGGSVRSSPGGATPKRFSSIFTHFNSSLSNAKPEEETEETNERPASQVDLENVESSPCLEGFKVDIVDDFSDSLISFLDTTFQTNTR